jgi:hypothetical protein
LIAQLYRPRRPEMVCNEHSAWSGEIHHPFLNPTYSKLYCFVPFRRDADFVDCGTLLDQLRKRCAAPASYRYVALVGLGGVGGRAKPQVYQPLQVNYPITITWAVLGYPALAEVLISSGDLD